MGSTNKAKRKPPNAGSADGEKALERETRADDVFSPRQKPAVRRPATPQRSLKPPSPQRSPS